MRVCNSAVLIRRSWAALVSLGLADPPITSVKCTVFLRRTVFRYFSNRFHVPGLIRLDSWWESVVVWGVYASRIQISWLTFRVYNCPL